MNLNQIATECDRLFNGLPNEYDFMRCMRSTWGMSFICREVIEQVYEIDDMTDPNLMTYFLHTGPEAIHDELHRLIVLLRLKTAAECLPLLDDGGKSNIHFQTPESGILWATTNFWRVARYKTVPEYVRFYEERNFDQRD